MQISQITSTRKIKNLIIKVVLILVIFIGVIVMLGKIEFPSPNKEIKKIIPNENLKIIK